MVDFRPKIGDPAKFPYNYEQLRFRLEFGGLFLRRFVFSCYKYTTNYKY